MSDNKTDALRADTIGMEGMVTALRIDKDALANQLAEKQAGLDRIVALKDASITSLETRVDVKESARYEVSCAAIAAGRSLIGKVAEDCWTRGEAIRIISTVRDVLGSLTDSFPDEVANLISRSYLELATKGHDDEDSRDAVRAALGLAGVYESELASLRHRIEEAFGEIGDAESQVSDLETAVSCMEEALSNASTTLCGVTEDFGDLVDNM